MRRPILLTFPTPILILIFVSRSPVDLEATLVVWDAQAGVVISWFNTKHLKNITFHGDQKTITLFNNIECCTSTQSTHFYTYNALSGIQICQGEIPTSSSGRGNCWAHRDTLQFATYSWDDNNQGMINLHTLQPTATPPHCISSSFQIPSHQPKFSFSPVSLHVSFAHGTSVVVYDCQNSEPLLYDGSLEKAQHHVGKFSLNGNFFAYVKSEHEIGVWQTTCTGYVCQSSLRSRLPFEEFSWSPTSISVMCWGYGGIQLLHTNNQFSSPVLKNVTHPFRSHRHLVAYSADLVHIAMAQQCGSIVTVLNHLSGTSQEFCDVVMEIWDIRIVDNAVFAVDEYKLVCWDLETGRILSNTPVAERVINGKPDIVRHMALSHDCSQIAILTEGLKNICLYDVKSRDVFQKDVHCKVFDTQFSPDGYQLWLTGHWDICYSVGLEMLENWSSAEVIERDPEDRWLSINHSPHKCCEIDSEWIVDSQGRKLLWLPPSWRLTDWEDVRLDGNFLALLHDHHPESIILELQL